MAKVLVLYYSSYGHIEQMAEAVAQGARNAGAQVDIKRIPETVPEEVARSAHFKLDQSASVATVEDLENYDAIVVGTGTRYGRMTSQMAAFLDQAGGLWQLCSKACLGMISPSAENHAQASASHPGCASQLPTLPSVRFPTLQQSLRLV